MNNVIENSNWFVLHNPASGGGKSKNDWPRIETMLQKAGIHFIKKTTEYKAHALEIINEALDNQYRKFIVIGGDGSLNETINAIYTHNNAIPENVTIGYLPVGTGNDWAKTMKIPASSYQKALDIIKNNKILKQDIGIVLCNLNGEKVKRYFLNIASVGYSGYIAQKLELSRAGGKSTNKFTYLLSIAKGLFKYKASQIKFSFNNTISNHVLYFGAIAIGKFFGNGMQPAPLAHPADDLFELTIVDEQSPLQVVRKMKNLYSGNINHYRDVHLHKTNEVSIESDNIIPIETDGEFIGETPATFQMSPKKINMIINNDEFLQAV